MTKEELFTEEGLRRFELAQAILRGAASQYKKVDAVSDWTLGAAGASAALVVANINKLSIFFAHRWFKRCLGFILVSVAFGLGQKLLALFVGQNLRVQKRVTQDLIKLLSGQPPVTPEAVVPLLRSATGTFVKASPWSTRWLVKWCAGRANDNPLFAMQAALRLTDYAWVMFVLQFLALCGTALALLKSLKPH